ncbi:MAG: FAD-dependent oxidoreductase, partial [Deltaproteobacteria bacterium]|nr:FAD-dependent oxidoreductase [Deltaproteobacteria bacterium]
MWDVIVAGAGPGGSLAAKRCAELGFKTLLLEKKKLPRDKVCSGMVAGPWATDAIKKEFGEIPKEILVPPYHLSGQMFHVPGASPRPLKWHTLLGWRKDLDAWMNEKAREKGVEIRDGAKVTGVLREKGRNRVRLETNKKTQYLEARFRS